MDHSIKYEMDTNARQDFHTLSINQCVCVTGIVVAGPDGSALGWRGERERHVISLHAVNFCYTISPIIEDLVDSKVNFRFIKALTRGDNKGLHV